MSGPQPVAEAVLALAKTVETEAAGSMFATRAAAIRERLEGPLRVAIAGRVKAGKLAEMNAAFDTMALMQQLGLIPAPPNTASR